MILLFLILLLIPSYLNAEVLNNQILCKTKLQKYYALKIYDITLCRNKLTTYESIFQTKFSIALSYKKSSSGSWIASRSLSEINKHYKLTDKQKQDYAKYFEEFFPSVKNMDEIKMDFDPNYGSTFYINNKFFGEIRDITFATRVANIWLHPNSTFKETRDFLLKNE